MEAEKISVIIPVYNGAAFLEECLKSVQQQTWDNFEAVILDDNSTDGTMRIAEEFVKRDRRFRLVQRTKRGVSSARNQGIEMTDGEFLTFVDADDRIDSEMLEKLVNFQKNSQSDFIICDYIKWDGKSIEKDTEYSINPEKTDIGRKCENILNIYDKKGYLSDCLLGGSTRCWGILYCRDFIGETRFRENLTIGEDLMFLADLSKNIRRAAVLKYRGYYYRVNAKGAMLRPFQPSYMDEIKSWRLAGEAICAEYPSLKDSADAKLAVSAMLAAGKLAKLPAKQRRKYRLYIKECRSAVLTALKTGGAREFLPAGYRLKTSLFQVWPAAYLTLYHIWKGR